MCKSCTHDFCDDHLGERDVGELKLSLVTVTPQARIVCVNGPCQRSHGEARAIVLPRHGRRAVHVLYRLDPGLLPERVKAN